MAEQRKALQPRDDGAVSVLSESQFGTEAVLHRAIANHPEALPHEGFGLGPMITVANELALAAGPLDLLLVDPQGRLSLCEFKKGSENPDVRKVVAQLLDYGGSLWRLGYDELEGLVRRAKPGFDTSLLEYAAAQFTRIGATHFDPDAFRLGVESSLESGAFVFLYVVRDIDEKTMRVMTYLAEGPRMSFFGVEVDHFTSVDHESFLVPRTVFVPSWVRESRPKLGDPDADRLIERMDDLAVRLGAKVELAETGKRYRGPGQSYIGVYRSSRGIEFALRHLRAAGYVRLADELVSRMSTWVGRTFQGSGDYPSFRCGEVLADWEQVRNGIIEPFLLANRSSPEQAEQRP